MSEITREKIRKLRKTAQIQRAELEDKEERNQKIRAFTESILPGIRRAFIYASYHDEADTTGPIDLMLKEGIEVFSPKVEGREMRFYRIRDLSDLKPGYKDIPEPEAGEEAVPEQGTDVESMLSGSKKQDLMFVPGLVFDRTGNRIGYGGGYYDRYLAAHPCLTAGLCFSCQIQDEELPRMPWDMPLDMLLSDEGLIKALKS